MRSLTLAFLTLASVLVIWIIGSEAKADGPVTISQVDMSKYPEITVYVTVVDDDGNLMTGLQKSDFAVKEDGVEVDLIDFAGSGEARAADIVFVFDTTTSMAEEVDAMKVTSLDFAEKLEQRRVNYRLGLVDFGDVINRVELPDGSLTGQATVFKSWIEAIHLAGGGHKIPELSLGAVQRAAQMSFRDDAMRVFILITDAPPHHYGDAPDAGVSFHNPNLNLSTTVQMLSDTTVTVYVVAPPDEDYLSIAEATGGKYFDIHGVSDFTTIIDDIGSIIAEQYRLVYVSPRPTYDGTRRDIEVTTDRASGFSGYLEPHLLNIRSNWFLGLILLALLVLALAAPVFWPGTALRKAEPASPPSVAPSSAEEVLTASGVATPTLTCSHCGQVLRPGANFCSSCGRRTTDAFRL